LNFASALQRSDAPLYRQVRAVLMNQIANGELRIGDQLPIESELCQQYKVSRATIRQALTFLEHEGLIERAAGRGTFLRSLPSPRALECLPERVSWGEAVAARTRRNGPVILHGNAVPPSIVEDELGLPHSTETYFFIKVLDDGRGPIAAIKRYFAPSIAELVTGKIRSARDFTRAFALAGRGEPKLHHGWIEAILAEPRFAALLTVGVGAPLTSLWWTDYVGNKPAICSQMLYSGEKIAITF